MNQLKDCLIIPCANRKVEGTTKAIDMYRGTLFEIFNSFPREQVLKHFNVLILSAKHGLIDASAIIEKYDVEMGKSTAEQNEFALLHKKSANKLLASYASKNVKLYTVLFTKYQSAFDAMNLTALKGFKSVYQSRNARGSGDHRGRLKGILKSKLDHAALTPILFRSGIASESEFNGYKASGQGIGSSLAYTNNKKVLNHIIDNIKAKMPTFVDNGLITAVSQGKKINETTIFEQYTNIARSIRGSQAMYCVVPDNPFCADNALSIVKTHKKSIRYLARKCQVILPIHKTNLRSVSEQARLLMNELGNVPITLGIPCRNKGENKWRMEMADIEAIFALKNENSEPLFNRVHFLALSEKSRGGIYEERKTLCEIYNVEMSADSCRTTALFGGEASNRKGSEVSRNIDKEYEEKVQEEKYKPSIQDYNANDECEDPMIWEELSNLELGDKIAIWNKCYPVCQIEYDEDDIEGTEEIFENCTSAYFNNFIEKVKYQFNDLFKRNITKFEGSRRREEAITRLFVKCSQQRTPVQQVMGF